MTRPSSRAKYWCFTENAEPEALAAVLQAEGLPQGITYLCGQLERGDHLHLQGYCELEARQRIPWLKHHLSHTAHFEIRRGTQEEAINYTSKDDDTTIPGTWFDLGEPTDERKGKRNDLLDVKAMLDDGASDKDIAAEHFGSWVRYRRCFQEYRQLISTPRDPAVGVDVVIYYGATGLGKSRAARESYPDAYVKPVGTDWFDGYAGEETVLLDEFRANWMSYGLLLSITDRYPCTVPCKGGHINFNAKRLVFTTNFHPKYWYKNDYYAALERRISRIIFFEKDQDPRESLPPFEDIPVKVFSDSAPPQNLIHDYPWN